MDWKAKLVLPPNYVSLRHLKELREKEKADLELKIREEAEAEYRFRVEEERRLKKLKEDEEMRLKEELEKRRDDEEKRQKEEEEKTKREREEEERLRREIIRRDQILRTRALLCGEPSRTTRRGKYSDQVICDKQQEEEIVVTESKEDETLEEREKKKKNKWRKNKRKKKKDYEKEALEFESHGVNETLKSETKSSEEEEKVIPLDTKPNGFKTRRQRNLKAKKIEMNQKVEEEIERKIGDLNVSIVDNKMKMVKKSKDYEKEALGSESQGVNKTLISETKSIEIEEEKVIITSDTKPNRFKNTRQRKLEAKTEIGDKQIEMNQTVEEEIEKQIGDLNVNNLDDKKKKKKKPKAEKLHFQQPQMTYTDRCPQSQIRNYSKYGKRIDSAMNPRNASGSSLVWVAKTDDN